MNQTFIIICADESKNAGERDYTFALMGELRAMKKAALEEGKPFSDVTTHVFKVPTAKTLSVVIDPKNFRPETNAEYRKVPPLPKDLADQLIDQLGDDVGEIVIIGAGHATLETVANAQAQLQHAGLHTKTAFITHALDNQDELVVIAEDEMDLFMPMTQDGLQRVYGAIAKGVKLNTIDTTPHSNTLTSMEAHCHAMIAATQEARNTGTKLPQMDHVLDWQRKNKPHAFAVINAGFEIEFEKGVKTWVPYTAEEAYAHGKALGEKLAKGTNLYAMHGGLRNDRDKEFLGIDPSEEFMRGYREIQGETSEAVLERYDPTFDDWNAIKVSYMLAQHPACVAYVSNAEGYGTMDGAAIALDNRKILLMAFPFKALEKDPSGSRQKNLAAYNNKGFNMIYVDADGSMTLKAAPKEAITPIVAPMNSATLVWKHFNAGMDTSNNNAPRIGSNTLQSGTTEIGGAARDLGDNTDSIVMKMVEDNVEIDMPRILPYRRRLTAA